MPAFSCSSRHFTHFAIYLIILGVGNFWRGFFVCSERKRSIFVSVLFCFYLLRLSIKFATLRHRRAGPGLFSLGAFPTFRSHDIRHGCLYVESSEGGRERRIEAVRYRRRLKIFENFLFLFISWKLLSVRQLPYKPFKSFNIGYLACARWEMDLQYILRKNL